jgi:predicted ABC-type sugar transport system permease subunit
MNSEKTARIDVDTVLKKWLLGKFGILLGLIILMMVFAFQSTVFMSLGNVKNIMI